MGTKRCGRCKLVKPVGEFGRDSRRKDGLRYRCKPCNRAASKSDYESHPERYARHRDGRRESQAADAAAHYRKNRELIIERMAQYRSEKPHVSWLHEYRRRARKFGIAEVIEPFTHADVIRTYGDRCAYCASGPFEQLDHYVPIRSEGAHTLANVRPSCAKCNRQKLDKQPGEWLAELSLVAEE